MFYLFYIFTVITIHTGTYLTDISKSLISKTKNIFGITEIIFM